MEAATVRGAACRMLATALPERARLRSSRKALQLLQPRAHLSDTVAAAVTYGCSLQHMRLQPPLYSIGLQPRAHVAAAVLDQVPEDARGDLVGVRDRVWGWG
eukprot:scaffold101026_cov45-Phaeocystis_antarctica.AAC.1